MNSPFMGQQVENCKSFTWTHYLANVFAMHCGPKKSKPIEHPTLYPTHISFIPSQSTFPFLKYGYQKFDLGNPRSMSWVRSKFKVTTWVQHPTDSHPFGSMSIHPLIPMIELFKIWLSKSKVKVIAQGHIVCVASYRLIFLSFHVDRFCCS